MNHEVYKAKTSSKRNRLSIDLAFILGLFMVFFFRCISVMNSYNERGGYAYVELLNYCMPIVEETVYDKTDYAENRVSIKNILMEAAYIDKINSLTIITSELEFFKGAEDIAIDNSKIIKEAAKVNIAPYVIDSGIISKVTEEQISNAENEAYDESLKKILDSSNPEVLIYHTHAHEAYSEIGEAANWRSDSEDLTIMSVGDVLTQELQESYGISVIHDKTLHDVEYNGCYGRSKETVENYLNQYGDFKLIIDLHRDSSENRELIATSLNGESLARFMFVLGESSPKLEANKKVVDDLLSLTRSLFPSLVREEYDGVFIYNTSYGTFNLGLSDNMLIIEDGSAGNSVEEAKLTAKYIARIIAQYINNLNGSE